MRRFCGYEQQNDANFQEKGCFLGYEGEFDDNFQEKGHFLGRQGRKTKKVCNMHTITRRFSAASSASARLSKKVEAAGTPDPSKASGRCAPDRGCLSEAKTGVKIVERNKGWLIANPLFLSCGSFELFVQSSSNVNRASNCTTYHRVVTDAEESHHLNVCWN